MRKIPFLLILLASSMVLPGQKSYVGFEMGIPTITWLDGNLENTAPRMNPVNVGLTGKIGLAGRMDVRVGGRLASLGAWIDHPPEGNIDEKVKFKYIQFPLLLSFQPVRGISLQAGGYYGWLYVAKWYEPDKRLEAAATAVITLGLVDERRNIKITEYCNPNDAGLLFGIGYQGDAGFIGLRYQHGFQNNFKTGDLSACNRALELIWEANLGAMFRSGHARSRNYSFRSGRN